MKSSLSLILSSISVTIGFVCSYFMEITMQNAEQYLAITALIFADGFFGVIAGVKREGLGSRCEIYSGNICSS